MSLLKKCYYLAEALEEASSINNDPYGEGWIIKIKPENMDDINGLLDSAAYTTKIGA